MKDGTLEQVTEKNLGEGNTAEERKKAPVRVGAMTVPHSLWRLMLSQKHMNKTPLCQLLCMCVRVFEREGGR